MKSFLDRFKRRDPDERAPEGASERTGGAPANKPAPVIHVVKAEPEASAPSLTPSPAAASPVTTVADSVVRLELGDFLHRIPQNLLRPGPHDVSMELRFDIAELSSLIARGQTSINLADLYARMPGIFRAEVRMDDNIEVRFPWQKLMSIVKGVGSNSAGKIGITQAAADALAQKLRSRRPARGNSPGSPATGVVAKSQPAAAQESAPAEAGKSGSRGRQPAWVSRAVSEKARDEALAGSTPSVDLEGPATPDSATPTPGGSPLTKTQGGFNQEELVRDGDAANLKYEEAKADFQRQIAALSAERDKALADLEYAREELTAKIKQLAERETATSAPGDSEHDAPERKLAAESGQVETLVGKVTALETSSDEKLAAVAQERDKALLELDNARQELNAKLGELERQQALQARTADEAAEANAAREELRQDLARKLTELDTLNADLAASRASGEEKLATITRELESAAAERDKVLGELEHARKDLAEKIEQIELQQSLDSENRQKKNEAEEKKNSEKDAELRQLRNEIEALKKSSEDQAVTIARERESILSERDKVVAELKRTRQELTNRVKQVEFQEGFGTRSSQEAARLNEERTRLQKELSDKARRMETLASETAELKKNNAAQHADLIKERDKIVAELEAARAELIEKNRQIEFQQSLSEKSGEDAAKLVATRAELQKQLDERNGEIEAIKTELSGLRKGGGKKFAVISEERDKVLGDLRRVRQELANKIEQIEFQQNLVAKSNEDAARALAERAVLEKNLAVRTEEFETLKKELAALTASSSQEVASFTAERDKLVADLERARTDLTARTEQIHRQEEANVQSAGEIKKLSAERDTLQKQLGVKGAELDALKNQLAELNRTNEAKVASLTAEHEKVLQEMNRARTDLAERSAQLKQFEEQCARAAAEFAKLIDERDSLKKDLAEKCYKLGALETEAVAFRQGSETKYAAVVAEREKIQADLQKARKELAQKIEQVEFQAGLATKSTEDTARLVAERDALKTDLVAKAADFEALKAQLADLTRSNDEKVAALTSEHARIEAELQHAYQEVGARNEKISFQEELSAKSAEDAARLVSEREALRKEVAGKNGELESIKAELKLLRQGSGKKYAAIAAERDKVLADLKRTREELAGKVEQIELQQSLVSKSGEDSAKANADREALRQELAAKLKEIETQRSVAARNSAKAAELAGERQALENQLAARTGEWEKLQTELALLTKSSDEKLTAVSTERDKILAELETARREIAERIKEVEIQQNLVARSREDITNAAAEQDALRKELSDRTSKFDALTSELATLRTENDEKLAALAQEREVLIQQKVGLAEQLAAAAESLTTRQKTVVEVELSKKENQRQIEELQRRIMAFESSQRETAQELSRERETRIKAERSLAAAERARQEATALVESLRVETRREYEIAARKREAEFARAQQELQEKLATLTEAQQKTLSERDDLASTIHKVREEAAASDTAAKNAFWESRAVASLEEDIENYRARIKSLLLEREATAAATQAKIDTLTREREEAARELAQLSAAHAQAASAQEGTREDLDAKVAAFAKEKKEMLLQLEQAGQDQARQAQELAAARATVQTTEAAVADLQHQLDKLSGERDRMQTDWEKLFAELESVKAQAREQHEKFAHEQVEIERSGSAANGDLQRQIAELKTSLDLVTCEQGGLQQELAAARAEYEQALARFDSERTAFAQTKTELENRVANAEGETNEIVARANALASTVQAREAELRERDAESKRLAEAHEQALAAQNRDRELRSLTEAKDQELAALTAELESIREEHEAQSAAFAREFKGVVKQRDDAVAAAESAQLELQEKESALAREKAAFERTETNVTSRLEREVVRLRRERDQLVRHRDELHTRVARMIEDQRQILDELAAESDRQGPLPNDVIQRQREPHEANVIEITTAEIAVPSELECGINLPRIHPLPIPPPNVRIL